MAKSIPIVTVTHLDFDSIAQSGDQEVIRQFQITCGLSKRKFFKKSVRYDRCRVVHGKNFVTIRFYLGDAETARFSFVPSPSFT